MHLLSYPDPPGPSHSGMSCWGALGATAYSPTPAPPPLLLLHPDCQMPTLVPTSRPGPGSAAGNGPSVAQPLLLQGGRAQGRGGGFTSRRAWLKKKAWLRPSPFPRWPWDGQEGSQPPGHSFALGGVLSVCVAAAPVAGLDCLGVPGRVSSSRDGRCCARGVCHVLAASGLGQGWAKCGVQSDSWELRQGFPAGGGRDGREPWWVRAASLGTQSRAFLYAKWGWGGLQGSCRWVRILSIS